MESRMPIDETLLRQELAKQDFELVTAAPSGKDGNVTVEANKLYHVSEDKNGPLYVPVSVSLQVTLDNNNNILKINGGTPSSDVTNDAKHFVKNLIDNHQIEGLSEKSPKNVTHKIEVNDKGQQVITRRGFSAY